MTTNDKQKLWRGLSAKARESLETRDYGEKGIDEYAQNAGELMALRGKAKEQTFIAGVELFPRTIYAQAGRGFFGEFARQGEATCGELGFWPRQWASARMFAGSAKGFHIHPPFIPEGEDAAQWFKKIFQEKSERAPFEREQWDMMFFIQGRAEIFLIDERLGLPRKRMRFVIYGDDQSGEHNAGLIIPPGVAHALRCDTGSDLIMVYGTTMTFLPENEGRISSHIEAYPTPKEWQNYWLDKA